MWWRTRKSRWPIDPEAVEFGSVVGGRDRNLSRTHVLVQFARSEPRCVLLTDFTRTIAGRLADGRPLRVKRLVVAPLTKRRHAELFDRLTDWGPATRRALGSSRGPRVRFGAAPTLRL